jgi:hypothetical protein
MDIIDKINIFIEDEIEEARMSGKTHAAKKSYERKHYRMTKQKKKSSLKKLKRSAEGNKREKRKDKLAKAGRTPTGKGKVKYHV